MTWAINQKQYSQRRACGLVGIAPKTYRYQAQRSHDGGLRKRMREIAGERRRFGYRQISCRSLGVENTFLLLFGD